MRDTQFLDASQPSGMRAMMQIKGNSWTQMRKKFE
jgi:hypothetical protein